MATSNKATPTMTKIKQS